MTGLKKAELQKLKGDSGGTTDGDPFPVQFNPATLRLQMTNQNEGGRSHGRQAEQHLGEGSTTLTMDLHFDTADEDGGGGHARSVLEVTKQVEQFVLPIDQQGKQAPPRVRFHWGEFVFDGVMNSIGEDIELFSSDGVPLRAKLSISIKGQDPNFAARKMGPGANQGVGALPPTASSAPPGSGPKPPGATDRTAAALGGESAAAFAARMGLDPAAWRGLSIDASLSLSLSAGLEVDFSAGLSASAGVGFSAGVEAGAAVSVDAAFGLSGDASAGFAVAAAGGVQAAVNAVQIVKAESAAADARAAFDVPAPPRPVVAAGGAPLGLASLPSTTTHVAAKPAPPEQPRPPISDAARVPAAVPPAPPAPAPPRADPRASSFGFGVPLRPRVDVVGAPRAVGPRPRADRAPVTSSPTQAPWTQLPAADPVRAVASGKQRRGLASSPCGCGCGGRH